VRGFEVDTLWFTAQFVVVAHGDGGKHLRAHLNGPFEYRDAAGNDLRMHTEKDEWEEWVPLLALRRDKIANAHVSTASVLRVDLASGRMLAAAPHEGYEGCEVTGPGFFIVGASDEPAIWTGKSWEQ
jgi:hypothetical protein